MSVEELIAEALRLPQPERAQLAEELLCSLEEPEGQVAASWARELERRSQDLVEGRVQAVDWDTASSEILSELENRRASRTSS
jgi:putative addiction module component (TIGR02574 family)